MRLRALIPLFCVLALASCTIPTTTQTVPTAQSAVTTCDGSLCAASGVSVFVEPDAGETPLLNAIKGASTSILVEVYLLTDNNVTHALEDAAKRGVDVELVLPKPDSGSSNSTDVTNLLNGGVHVRYITAPYMHAKLVVADGVLAFTGSENFSATSLDQNRELGIMIDDTQALSTFEHTFGLDWAVATAA